MYKIDFKIKTILLGEINNIDIITSTLEHLYNKIHSATSPSTIDGYLKLTLSGVVDAGLSLQLEGYGFFLNISSYNKVQKKFEEVLYNEMSKLYDNIKTEVVYCKVTRSNLFHFLFITLKEKLRRGLRRGLRTLKQNF